MQQPPPSHTLATPHTGIRVDTARQEMVTEVGGKGGTMSEDRVKNSPSLSLLWQQAACIPVSSCQSEMRVDDPVGNREGLVRMGGVLPLPMNQHLVLTLCTTFLLLFQRHIPGGLGGGGG